MQGDSRSTIFSISWKEDLLIKCWSNYVTGCWTRFNYLMRSHVNMLYVHSLFEILKHTGVGLDSTTKMVEATEEQWEGFEKKDPNARLMRHKSWPLYDDCANMGTEYGSNKVNDEKEDESESPGDYGNTGESSGLGKTSSGRKRKAPTTPDPFVGVVQKFCESASSRLGDIAQRIGHDQDMSLARKQIYSSISTMNILDGDI
ncbi:hypothetical protein ACS0TY_001955 [Phlomoides rotata]